MELDPETIRQLAHQAADIIADYLIAAPKGPAIRPTTLADAAARVSGPLPEEGSDPAEILAQVAREIAPYGVHNVHPRFLGYVGTSASISAVLAEGIAAALNLNVVTSKSRPTAVQVELTVLDWLRQLLGLPEGSGGLLTSGGTMANLLCLAAARQAIAPADVRREGLHSMPGPLAIYASAEAHACHQKAAELIGLGGRYLRRIPVDAARRTDVDRLAQAVAADRAAGVSPVAVVATAGTVGTGAVDPVSDIADFCAAEGLWLHVDACYGGFALLAADGAGTSPLNPGTRRNLAAMARADSVAADPHKFLFMPVEAGMAIVREPRHLWNAFSVSPEYLVGGEHNFFEYGLATSRAFRALKIWVALRHHGRRAFAQAIAENIRLARRLYRAVEMAPDLEPVGPEPELSIVCFRYLPPDLTARRTAATPIEADEIDGYVDRLNERLVADLQAGGEAYVSSTSMGGRPVIRACIVNYRTTAEDVDRFVALVRRLGAEAERR